MNPFRSIRQISNKKALDHLHLEPLTNNLLVPKDRIQPLQAKALPAVWGTTQWLATQPIKHLGGGGSGNGMGGIGSISTIGNHIVGMLFVMGNAQDFIHKATPWLAETH